jgi:hypothetical protein
MLRGTGLLKMYDIAVILISHRKAENSTQYKMKIENEDRE